MPVHIDRVLTEVIPEPEPGGGGAASPPPPWAEAERLRATLALLERDHARTRAEGFDD